MQQNVKQLISFKIVILPLSTEINVTENLNNHPGDLFECRSLFIKIGFRGGSLFGSGDLFDHLGQLLYLL